MKQNLDSFSQLELIHARNSYDKQKTLSDVLNKYCLPKNDTISELEKIEKNLIINFSNFHNLKNYISNNIILINSDLSRFTETKTLEELKKQNRKDDVAYQKTDIENELKSRLSTLSEEKIRKLIVEIEKGTTDIDIIIENFAKRNILYKTDVRNVIDRRIESEISEVVLPHSEEVSKSLSEAIEDIISIKEKQSLT